jgi:hypothetical protein
MQDDMLTPEEIREINEASRRKDALIVELNGGLSKDEARIRRDQGDPALPPLDAQGVARLLEAAASWPHENHFRAAFDYLTQAARDGRIPSPLKTDIVRRLIEIGDYESPESRPCRWKFSSSREYHAAHDAWFAEDIERGSRDSIECIRRDEAWKCLGEMGREARIALPRIFDWGDDGVNLAPELWKIVRADEELIDALVALAEQEEERLSLGNVQEK